MRSHSPDNHNRSPDIHWSDAGGHHSRCDAADEAVAAPGSAITARRRVAISGRRVDAVCFAEGIAAESAVATKAAGFGKAVAARIHAGLVHFRLAQLATRTLNRSVRISTPIIMRRLIGAEPAQSSASGNGAYRDTRYTRSP